MALNYDIRDEVSPRDITRHQWESDMFDKQAELTKTLKELDIQAMKLESKITAWFKLPLYIIMLPVRILFVIPLCIYAIKSKEVPKELWNLLR